MWARPAHALRLPTRFCEEDEMTGVPKPLFPGTVETRLDRLDARELYRALNASTTVPAQTSAPLAAD